MMNKVIVVVLNGGNVEVFSSRHALEIWMSRNGLDYGEGEIHATPIVEGSAIMVRRTETYEGELIDKSGENFSVPLKVNYNVGIHTRRSF